MAYFTSTRSRCARTDHPADVAEEPFPVDSLTRIAVPEHGDRQIVGEWSGCAPELDEAVAIPAALVVSSINAASTERSIRRSDCA